MKERIIVPGALFQHFKGNLYQIITLGKHSETGEEMVVYQEMYGEFQVYIRPVSMFLEKLDLMKYPDAKQEYRFELVKYPYEIRKQNEHKEEKAEQQIEALDDIVERAKNEPTAMEERKQTEQVEQLYIAFFDAETCKEKLDIIRTIKDDMDSRMLNNIAASMDLPVEDDNFEDTYEIVVKNLEQRSRFECNRFR